METIGFIGGGNMAEALIKGIISAKVYKRKEVYVSDIRAERLEYIEKQYGVCKAGSNSALAEGVDTIVLSVKPQNMVEVLTEIKGAVKDDTLIVSIAAGIKTANIATVLGQRAIVRVMPNMAALIGEGASAIFSNDEDKVKLETAKRIFDSVGKTVVVDDEKLIDAVTAVSGSGPAYYFLLMEAMIKAGVGLGLSEEAARLLVLQTAKGAALLAVEAGKKGENPCQLRERVASRGGTTEAALKVLSSGDFVGLMAKAMEEARDRSIQLSL